MQISRRSFLSTSLAATAASCLPRLVNAEPVQTPLGFDNFAIRAFGWKADQLIDYAATLSIDTLFLSDMECLPSLEDSALKDIKSHADAKGLKLYTGSWSICPTSVRFKNTWGSAVDHLKTGIRVSKALGSPVFRVILGVLDDRKTPGGIRARMADTLQVLQTCKKDALDAGIKIAIENHAGDMHSWELAELVEQAGTDFVGVNIDSGNAAWTLEDPLDVLERLGPYVICSSLRDDMIWQTPDGASVQWTAIGDGIVDWKQFMERYRHFCHAVPFQIETISGFAKNFPYKTEKFWEHYDKRPEALAHFEALAAKGHFIEPFKVPAGADKKEAEQSHQKAELERSLAFCKNQLGLGLRKA
ncbi:MAG: sugar phosphate isomerase/epimerase [Verrucomicrobiota bacterium]